MNRQDKLDYLKQYRSIHKEERKQYINKNRDRINARRKIWYRKNIDKVKKVNAEQYKKHKTKHENYRLKSLFGISVDDYNEMLEQQNRVCAICKCKNTGGNQYGKSKMNVDHNHITGKVRGLLCSKCNLALGGLDVDTKGTELLYEVIKYIEDNNCA